MTARSAPLCFVIMPFTEKLAPIFRDAIRPAVRCAGFECVRGDSATAPGVVMKFVVEQLFAADAIVADLSFPNPNIFYELDRRQDHHDLRGGHWGPALRRPGVSRDLLPQERAGGAAGQARGRAARAA
jgi:hypothetical protein